MGEIFGSHWTATARLKLGSPQLAPDRCCPATIRLPHWVHGAYGQLAAMTLSRLTNRVWSNNKLSDHTKVNVYKACVISTLLYGSEFWTMHAHQEKRLNMFHMRCLRRILGIAWQVKVTNKVVLEKAYTLS